MKNKQKSCSLIRSTFDSSKDLVKKHGATSIVALIVSSLIPMLQQWYTDKQQAEALNTVEVRLQKQIDDFKKEEAEKNRIQWEVISKKADK